MIVPTRAVLMFTGLLYVYVVTVNKVTPFLWITLVLLSDSWTCGRHNRLHSVCGNSGYTRVTFDDFRRQQSYPVYVHSGSTRIARVYRAVIHRLQWITGQARIRAFNRLTERARAQCALQVTRRIEVVGEIAFERPRLALDLRGDEFRAERGPDEAS